MAEDVADAARRGTLVSEVVLGKGTEARYTVDGLKAVNRQLLEDILPQVYIFTFVLCICTVRKAWSLAWSTYV